MGKEVRRGGVKYIKELAVSQWRGADVVDARGDGQQWKTGAGQIHKGPEAKKKKKFKVIGVLSEGFLLCT